MGGAHCAWRAAKQWFSLGVRSSDDSACPAAIPNTCSCCKPQLVTCDKYVGACMFHEVGQVHQTSITFAWLAAVRYGCAYTGADKIFYEPTKVTRLPPPVGGDHPARCTSAPVS